MTAPDTIKRHDVVECVDTGPDPLSLSMCGVTQIRELGVYRVEQAITVAHVCTGEPIVVVTLVGINALIDTTTGYYGAFRFRKIEAPDTFVSLMIRSCRPRHDRTRV